MSARDELRELLEQATPGPWEIETDTVEHSYDYPDPRDCEFLWRIPGVVNFAEEDTSTADARLVAWIGTHAADVLALIDAAEKFRDRLDCPEYLRDAVDQLTRPALSRLAGTPTTPKEDT